MQLVPPPPDKGEGLRLTSHEGLPLTDSRGFRERRTFRDWRRIATITFDQAVVSYNGDFVIHFRHPTWRDDQNDPATATRVNGRKVR